MARVLGIIGARLNSSRLPGKQLLDLAGKPLIARVFERLERVAGMDTLVLATTADDYNRPLVEWARANGKRVFAFDGDVNDLVGRVDAVVRAEDPEMVLYFCGDSPLMEPETIDRWIGGYDADPPPEWVEFAPPPAGKWIHEGFVVYPRALWDRIVGESRSADHREHVGSVLRDFVGGLRTRTIAEDPVFGGREQRISVDTPSDYAFMSEVYRRWYAANGPGTIVSLRWVIAELERDPALGAINAQVRQKALGEHSLPILLVCHAGPGMGLGHLGRCLALARLLQDRHFAGVRLLIQGAPVEKPDLALIPHRFVGMDDDLLTVMAEEIARHKQRVAVFDLHSAHLPPGLQDFLAARSDLLKVGIDSVWPLAAHLDLMCLPAFTVPQAILDACGATPVLHGWPHYLLRTAPRAKPWRPGRRVLVLTGGSDATGLGATLPGQLDAGLPEGLEVDWVRGPYSAAPVLPANPRQQWHVHHAPGDLAPLMEECDYALTIYGVSVFELLGRGIPAVVFSPYGHRDDGEMAALAGEGVALVEADATSAVAALGRLLGDTGMAARLAAAGPAKVDGQGPARLAAKIYDLMAARP